VHVAHCKTHTSACFKRTHTSSIPTMAHGLPVFLLCVAALCASSTQAALLPCVFRHLIGYPENGNTDHLAANPLHDDASLAVVSKCNHDYIRSGYEPFVAVCDDGNWRISQSGDIQCLPLPCSVSDDDFLVRLGPDVFVNTTVKNHQEIPSGTDLSVSRCADGFVPDEERTVTLSCDSRTWKGAWTSQEARCMNFLVLDGQQQTTRLGRRLKWPAFSTVSIFPQAAVGVSLALATALDPFSGAQGTGMTFLWRTDFNPVP